MTPFHYSQKIFAMGATAVLHYSQKNSLFPKKFAIKATAPLHYTQKNLQLGLRPRFIIPKNLPWGLPTPLHYKGYGPKKICHWATAPLHYSKKICHKVYDPTSLFPKIFAMGATAQLHYTQKYLPWGLRRRYIIPKKICHGGYGPLFQKNLP